MGTPQSSLFCCVSPPWAKSLKHCSKCGMGTALLLSEGHLCFLSGDGKGGSPALSLPLLAWSLHPMS